MQQIELVRKMNQFGAGTFIDTLSNIVSASYFLVPVYLVINALIYIYDREKSTVVMAGLALALVIHFFVHEFLIKFLLGKIYFLPRPFVVDSSITTIGNRINNSTFPSGHVSSVVAFLTVLVWQYPKLWPFALIFVLIIGFSRIHNGMHFLTDVIGGVVFGILYGLLAIFIMGKLHLT